FAIRHRPAGLLSREPQGKTMKHLTTCAWCALLLFSANLCAQVPYQRIARAEREPEHWLTYSGSYRSHRFTALDQITTNNVARLRPAWIYQTKPGLVEASPIVVDGVMFITEPPSTVTALDVHTGRPLWSWTPSIPRDVKHIGFSRVNRGVAILDDTVYVATLHAHLVALDAKSGAVRWDTTVADNKTGHAMTLAPLALAATTIDAISGPEPRMRGYGH